ncbi:MAG TPA: rRNA maturation RNase YbeY [Chloroflexota bacterium]|nr:rRNA maturation RNase YbeY [Chloroflexota bacterium]
MDGGEWALEVSVQAEGGTEPPMLRTVLERAVRLGIEAPDRPVAFGVQPVLELNLLLTDDKRIHELNRVYRGIDQPTDVLSFSQIEGNREFVPAPSGRLALGDVIVSVETARRQAADQGHALDAELRHLAVHGALHLLGYDHETDEDEARMDHLAQQALAS